MTPKFAQYSYDDDYVSVLFTPKKHIQMHIHTLTQPNINKTV